LHDHHHDRRIYLVRTMKSAAAGDLKLLQSWARRAFEDAYRRQPREQASREDILYGFVEALRWARVALAFRPNSPEDMKIERLAE
jgi:hypothetical protein